MRTSSTPGKPSQKALSKTARVFLVAVFWLAVWEGVYLLLANDLLVVSPQAVIRRLGELAKTANFWRSIGVSFGRVLLGYGIGTIAGCFSARPADGSRRSTLF